LAAAAAAAAATDAAAIDTAGCYSHCSFAACHWPPLLRELWTGSQNPISFSNLLLLAHTQGIFDMSQAKKSMGLQSISQTQYDARMKATAQIAM